MKLLSLVTFLTVSVLTFSGCVATLPTPNAKPVVDSTLPMAELTANGVIVDMKAIGFEWNSIKDPRVKGIYIYKQTMGENASEYKFHHTVDNRFVTHYVDEDVEPQSQYAYYFKTFSKDAEGNPSKETIVETLPVLDSVSWIHAVQEMPRSAKIIWRPHNNQIVKEYILERKTLEEDEWTKIETIKGRLTAEFIDTELKDNFVYKYRMRVVTYNDITSNPSKEVKVVTKALPKQVESILATDNLPKQIMLVWSKTDIVDFAHYNVYRSTRIDGRYKLIVSPQETKFVDEIQKDGQDYFYRVSTVDKDGLESKHGVNSVHGKTLDKPITPSLVEAKMVGDNLEINWSSSDPRVKSFIVTKSAKKSWFDSTSEEFIDIKSKSFVDTSIAPETTYTYEVYSVDEFSIKSDPSIEIKYTTTKDEGRIPEPVVDPKADIEVKKAPVQDGGNVVQPMDDVDVSSL